MRVMQMIAGMAITLMFSYVLISCKAEPCDDVVCANGGVCTSGLCLCPEGFEGVRCETMSRDKFLGTYSVAEDGSISLPANYSTNIHEAGDGFEIDAVKLKGFYNFFEDQVYGICKGDSLIIPAQWLEGGYHVEGYGLFTAQDFYANHGTLDVYYQVTGPNGDVNDFGIDAGDHSEWSK